MYLVYPHFYAGYGFKQSRQHWSFIPTILTFSDIYCEEHGCYKTALISCLIYNKPTKSPNVLSHRIIPLQGRDQVTYCQPW